MTLRAAVVGLGAMGRHHARLLSRLPGVELVAACDVDADRANEHAQRWSTTAVTAPELLPADLDLAIVAVPTQVHRAVAEPLLCELVAAAGFENMKQNAARFVPDPGRLTWKREEDFFAKGANAQWREVLTADDLALYDGRLAGLLPAGQAAWLNSGSKHDSERGET